MRCFLPVLILCVSCKKQETTTTPTTPTPTDTTPDDTGTETTPSDTGTPSAEPLELCINEFMPGNIRSWQDDQGLWPDWIELHNPGAVDVDLLGWSITDDRSERHKHHFTASLIVEAGGYLVLAADATPALGPIHLSFSLATEGEDVALFREDGSAEIVGYGKVVSDIAVARVPDCGPIDSWEHVYEGSPGASNDTGTTTP